MKIVVGNSYSKIVDISESDEELIQKIDDALSEYQPGYFFSNEFKSGFWDGKVRFYQRKTHSFPSGLLNKVLEVVEEVELEYENNEIKVEIPDEEIKLFEPSSYEGCITLRDYQYNAVKTALEKRRGIINVATNGGKTEIAAGIIKLLASNIPDNNTILFFTHSKEIFHQSAERLSKRLDMEIGKVGDGLWNIKPVTVVMIPTVSRHLKPPKVEKLTIDQYKGELRAAKLIYELIGNVSLDETTAKTLAQVLQERDGVVEQEASDILVNAIVEGTVKETYTSMKKALRKFEKERREKIFKKHNEVKALLDSAICFIVDECHHASSDTWYETLMTCQNAVYRIGLTGTVDKSQPINVLRLEGCTGEVIIKISNDFLIGRGYSAKPTIFLEEVREPALKDSLSWQEVYRLGIIENDYRNRKVVELVAEKYGEGKGVLVIVNWTSHGESLLEMLKQQGIPCEFTHGGRNSEDRERILQDLRYEKLKVLIATSILDEGVDVPGINVLVMAAGGKSFRQTLQRIGRGLRKKKDGSGLEVYDFLDYHHRLLAKHTKERLNYYRDEKFDMKKL